MLSLIRRSAAAGMLAALPASAVLACSGGLHIEIETAGVYALDQAQIAATAPELADCPRESLVLRQRGEEVPMRISGAGGPLQPGDRIEWVGRPLHGPLSWFDAYSTVNVYELSAAPGAHARFTEVATTAAAAPASLRRQLHLEQENLMIRLSQSHVKQWEEADFWHWAKLTHVDPEPFALEFDLPDLAPQGAELAFKLKFRGMSTAQRLTEAPKPADHQVLALLDGKTVATFTWEGRAEVEQTLNLPAAALRAKGNRLTLQVPKRSALSTDPNNFVVDVVMFNSVNIDYPVGGDLAQAELPLRVSAAGKVDLRHAGTQLALYGDDGRRWSGAGGHFGRIDPGAVLYPVLDDKFASPTLVRPILAKTDWRKPAAAIDYIIISHSRLIDAIQPLAEFHRQRGLKVAVMDVDEVYDQFNHGISHPQAIRNLMQSAWKDWPEPKPRFALLVGDASFDIRHQRINRRNLAKWADMELLMPGQFGDIGSTPYQETPDLKHRNLIPTWQFMSYDGQSASDNHFVSVGEDPMHPVIAIGRFPVVDPAEITAIVNKTINYASTPRLGAWRRDVMFITDESEHFKRTSDQIASTLDNEGFVTDKVYASKDEADNIAHQSSIKDGLNEGRLLVHFIGHGGRYIWRTGPPDLRKNHDLFTLEDVSALTNTGKLPMVLSMTCYSAPFDNPTEDSIGERFLREPDRGAIAVFAASWRNSPSPAYSRVIVEQLTKPGVTIGEAIIAGKKPMTDDTLVETYNLLGDPAVILERPAGEFQLVRKPRPFGPDRIEAQINRPSFRGMVDATWVDKTGKPVYSTRFAAMGVRFQLPDPPAAVLAIATEVRGYVADPGNPFDAIARLDMKAPPPPPADNAPKTRTVDVVRQGDVLRRGGFDGSPAGPAPGTQAFANSKAKAKASATSAAAAPISTSKHAAR
jgi:Peptidase family C25